MIKIYLTCVYKVATWLTVLDCPAFCRKPIAGAKLGKPIVKYTRILSVEMIYLLNFAKAVIYRVLKKRPPMKTSLLLLNARCYVS